MPFIAKVNTTMEEMFSHMGNVAFPQLVRGAAKSIGEFYNSIVQVNELDEDVVRRWWMLLRQYCSPDNDRLVAFVRRYGNCKPRTCQRRGFLSVYENGPRYVFCDNSLADYFYAMAKARFVPNVNDFSDFIFNRQMPVAVRCASEEYEELPDGRRRFQAYGYLPSSRPCGLYKRWRHPNGRLRDNKMWYLAHILDVDNPRNYREEYGLRSGRIFSQGQREDWAYHPNADYPYRDMREELCEDDRRVIVAHFLRLVNPMNYFLTPQKGKKQHRLQNLRVPDFPSFRQGIQDLPQMQDFMRNRRREQYDDLFAEYEELAMALPVGIDNNVRLSQMAIDLQYCPPDQYLDVGAVDVLQVNRGNHPASRRGFEVTYGERVVRLRTMLDVACWVIQQYVAVHPNAGIETIRTVFKPLRMFKARAVAQQEVNWQEKYPRDSIACANNNEQLLVNRNWVSRGNWIQFVDSARANGFSINCEEYD